MAYKIVKLIDGRTVTLDWIRKEDLPDVVEALNSVIKEGRFLFLNDEITDMNAEIEWFEHAMKDGMIYLVARTEGKVIAGASMQPQTGKHAHIASYGIFIHKDYRDLGLGTALTTEMINIARERGFEIVQLSVYASNTGAKHVYEKCGFKEVGRLTRGIRYPNGTYTDEILMELLMD